MSVDASPISAPLEQASTAVLAPAPAGLDGWPRVSVVIPALNEEANLRRVLPRIPRWVYEVLLVDGQSTDGTVELARHLLPGIRIVRQEGRGKGNALRAGFEAATGDVLVALDADGSTDPEEIPAFVGALLSGADYAKGSRYLQGAGTHDISPFRALGNGSLLLTVRLLFHCRFSDLCYGYNAFWRRVLPALNLDSDGFEIETLMNLRAIRAELRVVEVASFEAPRAFGESRLRALPDGWRVLRTIFRVRFGRGTALGSSAAPVCAPEEQAISGLGETRVVRDVAVAK